jgi:hypothetical protein
MPKRPRETGGVFFVKSCLASELLSFLLHKVPQRRYKVAQRFYKYAALNRYPIVIKNYTYKVFETLQEVQRGVSGPLTCKVFDLLKMLSLDKPPRPAGTPPGEGNAHSDLKKSV